MEGAPDNNPEWVRPDLKKEKGEIERVIRKFLGKEIIEENIEAVEKVLETAPIVELSDADWAMLENTESFHEIGPGQLAEVERVVDMYNQDLAPENKRDFKKLLVGFQPGNRMQTPTILKYQGKLHLISGNTRLMIARALNVRPKVIIGEIK